MIVAAHPTQTPDAMKHAMGFLRSTDPAAKDFHFRTFPERGSEGAARSFTGSLAQVNAKLKSQNETGAGVFVVANKGGKQRPR